MAEGHGTITEFGVPAWPDDPHGLDLQRERIIFCCNQIIN